MWTVSADGHAVLDWNHPESIDETAVTHAIDAALLRPGVLLVVVEGLFALSLPSVVRRAAWRVYVDTPDDIRLARKILRKIEAQRQDPDCPCATICRPAGTATQPTSRPPGQRPIWSWTGPRARRRCWRTSCH